MGYGRGGMYGIIEGRAGGEEGGAGYTSLLEVEVVDEQATSQLKYISSSIDVGCRPRPPTRPPPAHRRTIS